MSVSSNSPLRVQPSRCRLIDTTSKAAGSAKGFVAWFSGPLNRWLAPDKFGQSALVGGADAFLEVFCPAQPRLLLKLDVGGGAHALGQARAQRRARLNDTQRGGERDLGGKPMRC